jgi:hypothetical protein
MSNIHGGDNRFYNNILVGRGGSAAPGTPASNAAQANDGFGLWVYDGCESPLLTGGNVYYCGARPYFDEVDAVLGAMEPELKVVHDGQHVYLHLTVGQAVQKASTTLVTTRSLGQAKVPGLSFENPNGSPLRIDTDYFGKRRNEAKPTPGPFENPATGPLELNVW